MGFDEKCIKLIMGCLDSVSFTIMINGFDTPRGGLKQGDPLSPYLFLLCSEGFNALLEQAETTNKIKGVCVAQGAPSINHLFFADDSILFFPANQGTANCHLEILNKYEPCSGQQINRDKLLCTSALIPLVIPRVWSLLVSKSEQWRFLKVTWGPYFSWSK